jgi:hypothetical protein
MMLGAIGIALMAGGAPRLRRRRAPLAPEDWPPTGYPTLALATGDGIWRLLLRNGQAYRANAAGEPLTAIELVDGEPPRIRAASARVYRESLDWRDWRLDWPPPGAAHWSPPTLDRHLVDHSSAGGLPGRGRRVLARLDDGAGGVYLAIGPRIAAAALASHLAGQPDPPRLAGAILRQRQTRIYHFDLAGTRRLIASGLPPVFALCAVPTTGRLAGPVAPIALDPIAARRAPSRPNGDRC